jgi:excisionase family DNA binding protein
MDSEPILLKVPECARLLSISRAKCYALVAEGIIPTVMIGSVRRVPAEFLNELAAAWRTGDGPQR